MGAYKVFCLRDPRRLLWVLQDGVKVSDVGLDCGSFAYLLGGVELRC